MKPCFSSALLFVLLCLFSVSAAAEMYETFLEPNQVVDMESSYRERLVTLHVQEGDHVEKGQLLAEFDSAVLQARLNLAEMAVELHGKIDAARALVRQRKTKLEMLENLKISGNARPQELESAQTNLVMAEAQLLSAREEQKMKNAELAVTLAQFEEKQLRSPLAGVIARVYKQEAELVGGNEQQPILILVQLDPLLAVFHLPLTVITDMRPGQRHVLSVAGGKVEAEVDFVSPVIEAQSGTVTVRFRLPNPDSLYISGSRVTFSPNFAQGAAE